MPSAPSKFITLNFGTINTMKNIPLKSVAMTVTLLSVAMSPPLLAAISLDRTRVIFDGGQNSVSLSLNNENKQLPYLAQGWLEDEQGNKVQSPLTVLPPVQRIEPGKPSQIKIQALPAAKQLPQDRETLYYFNLREIPPRSDKANTLQIALQTRIKLFYRPRAIMPNGVEISAPWQEQLTLTRLGDKYQVNNPTPYYITIVEVDSKKNGEGVKEFTPLMVAPNASTKLAVSAASLGDNPVLTYVNDYGGRPKLLFSCNHGNCKVVPERIAIR
jgi:chaperone protein PapD